MDFMSTKVGVSFVEQVPRYLKSISSSLESIAKSLEVIAENQQKPKIDENETSQK